MKLSVYNTADNEFKRSDYSATGKTADKKSFRFYSEARNIYQQIRKASRECHCPMRKATESYFNSAVQYGTKAVNK